MLHIITRLDRGGSTENTLLSLRLKGFEPFLLFGRTQDPPPLWQEVRREVTWFELPELRREVAPLQDLKALFRLWRHLRQNHYDIVHTHTTKAGLLGRIASFLACRGKRVHTPHGHIFYGGYLPWWSLPLYRLIEKGLAWLTDALVALTRKERDDHLRLGIGTPGKWHVIPSGVDLRRFRPSLKARLEIRRRFGVEEGDFWMVCVARLVPVKGHRYLLEAFAQLLPKYPFLRLALVGDGPLEGMLREQAKRLGVAQRVDFLGWREDLPELLNGFDLFVLPSLNEGQGRAVVEAQACGLPVVVTATGAQDVVGEAGLVVPPASSKALAEAVAFLLDHPEVRRQWAYAARRQAFHFRIEEMHGRLEALYRNLLACG